MATTWELSQPQGPSQMVVPGANASRKIEFKLEEVPLNSFSGMCLISNSLRKKNFHTAKFCGGHCVQRAFYNSQQEGVKRSKER